MSSSVIRRIIFVFFRLSRWQVNQMETFASRRRPNVSVRRHPVADARYCSTIFVFTVARRWIRVHSAQLVPFVWDGARCAFCRRWQETADWIWSIRTPSTWRPSGKRRNTRNFTPSSASTRAASVSQLVAVLKSNQLACSGKFLQKKYVYPCIKFANEANNLSMIVINGWLYKVQQSTQSHVKG